MIFREWNSDRTDFNIWDADRIRNAFNFGRGTLEDFKRYMHDNRHKHFEVIA